MIFIEDFLREGSDKAITRKELSRLTGFEDRKVREELARVAETQYPVINMGVGDGYFVPTDDEAAMVYAYIRREKAKAESIMRRVAMCEKWLNDLAERLEHGC